MTYKFEIEMTATISDQVVKEMIIKEVEHQTGKQVSNIIALEGGGFQVTFDPNSKTKVIPFESSKEFIVNHFIN